MHPHVAAVSLHVSHHRQAGRIQQPLEQDRVHSILLGEALHQLCLVRRTPLLVELLVYLEHLLRDYAAVHGLRLLLVTGPHCIQRLLVVYADAVPLQRVPQVDEHAVQRGVLLLVLDGILRPHRRALLLHALQLLRGQLLQHCRVPRARLERLFRQLHGERFPTLDRLSQGPPAATAPAAQKAAHRPAPVCKYTSRRPPGLASRWRTGSQWMCDGSPFSRYSGWWCSSGGSGPSSG
mmetsp:Transcript_29159/g.73238  ORF Transcript_29159/g.73238 Transcript_29159/m.73238 type:complete len:236 (+) Transcript_29159:288-995(+)